MRDPDVIYADPWLNKAKKTTRLPNGRGKNHPAYVDSALNYFFCPWCGYKGGVEELTAFVKGRHH